MSTGTNEPARRSSAATVEAVRAGQHHVEHDHVEGGALGEQERERRLAVGGRLDLVAFGLKVEAEAVGEVLLVFDD